MCAYIYVCVCMCILRIIDQNKLEYNFSMEGARKKGGVYKDEIVHVAIFIFRLLILKIEHPFSGEPRVCLPLLVHCTLYIVHCTLYTVQCTVY